jgi:signal peptidase II
MTPKLKAFLAALAVAFPLDQLTKAWIASSLSYADRITVIDGFFYITHVRNPGAAFGMFVDAPAEFRLPIFIGVGFVAVAIIVSFFRRLAPGDRHAGLVLGLILGGALGNLTDRIVRGEVVDFLHFRLWSGYTWPDFNLADSFIVVGVALLILEILAIEGESRAGHRTVEPGS